MGIEGIGYMDGAVAAPIPEVVTAPVTATAVASQESVAAQTPAAVQQNAYRSQNAQNTQNAEATTGQQAPPDDRHIQNTLDKAISAVNKRLGNSSYMEYEYFKPTKNVVIKVLDQETKEVIREIPPKKHLEAIVKMWELAGIMVDEKK